MTGTTWTYWADYDCNDLDKVSQNDRQHVWADWLEERVQRNVIKPLRKIKDEQIQPNPDDGTSALLVYSVSLFCAVEAMGKYFTGSVQGNGNRFKAFVKKYMHSDYSKIFNGEPYVDHVWKHFRNGLAHGFAISRGKFEQSLADPYFVESTDGAGHDVLSMNWDRLFDDFEQACRTYFNDVRSAPAGNKIVTDFEKVFKEVIVDRN